MKLLLIGSGGREHAMAWKLAQSKKVEKIFVAPGNGGTAIENKCENVNLTEIDDLIKFADADINASGTESIHDLLYQWIKVDKLMYEEICKKDEYQKLIQQYKMEKQAYVSKVYV